jgi:hypothetical protein
MTTHRIARPDPAFHPVLSRFDDSSGHHDDLALFCVPPADFKISCPTHLLHHRYVPPTWLTARLTRFAFSGCDDEHSQAQRRVGV